MARDIQALTRRLQSVGTILAELCDAMADIDNRMSRLEKRHARLSDDIDQTRVLVDNAVNRIDRIEQPMLPIQNQPDDFLS